MALIAASNAGNLAQLIRVLERYPNVLEEFTIPELDRYIVLLSVCAKRSKGSFRKNIETTITILKKRRDLLV